LALISFSFQIAECESLPVYVALFLPFPDSSWEHALSSFFNFALSFHVERLPRTNLKLGSNIAMTTGARKPTNAGIEAILREFGEK